MLTPIALIVAAPKRVVVRRLDIPAPNLRFGRRPKHKVQCDFAGYSKLVLDTVLRDGESILHHFCRHGGAKNSIRPR